MSLKRYESKFEEGSGADLKVVISKILSNGDMDLLSNTLRNGVYATTYGLGVDIPVIQRKQRIANDISMLVISILDKYSIQYKVVNPPREYGTIKVKVSLKKDNLQKLNDISEKDIFKVVLEIKKISAKGEKEDAKVMDDIKNRG